MMVETAEDYEKLLSRYNQLPKQLQQMQELMKEGVAKGIINHKVAMVGDHLTSL